MFYEQGLGSGALATLGQRIAVAMAMGQYQLGVEFATLSE